MLALVGRLEVRDWIDVIECDARLQPLGYLAWAASGKDPGLGPAMILAEAARSSRYSAEEVAALTFDGPTPYAGRIRGALPRLVAGPPAPASAARPARRSPGPSRARRPGRAGQ